MTAYEYTVTPAPDKGDKRTAKTPADRYAMALSAKLNEMAAEGWEYLRADVLPSEERAGLTGRTLVYHNLLVFRRPLAEPAQRVASPVAEPPVAAPPVVTPPAPEVTVHETPPAPIAPPAPPAPRPDTEA